MPRALREPRLPSFGDREYARLAQDAIEVEATSDLMAVGGIENFERDYLSRPVPSTQVIELVNAVSQDLDEAGDPAVAASG